MNERLGDLFAKKGDRWVIKGNQGDDVTDVVNNLRGESTGENAQTRNEQTEDVRKEDQARRNR